MEEGKKSKVVFDCDTGIDDALAIAYLVAQENVDLVGVTTAFGNATADQAYHNTVDLLASLGRPDIPVFRGEECPYGEDSFVVSDVSIRIHGRNGIGESVLPRVEKKEEPLTSSEFLVEASKRYGKDLVIVATGAMTNLEKAVEMDRAAILGAGKIVVMAGALTVEGNASIYAEGNMSRDPMAASLLFGSGVPLTMVGLDVSLTTVISEKELSAWAPVDTPVAETLRTMCRYYYTNEGDSAEELCGCLHDPLAAALAIRPEYILQSFRCDLMVVTEGEAVGRTIRDPRYLLGGPENHTVILKVKSQAFVDEFVSSIGRYLGKIQSGRTR